jgi:hypothetical protein
VEKYCGAGQVTDDNMDRVVACWIPKAVDTHSKYVINFFHHKYDCKNTPQCYDIRVLLTLLYLLSCVDFVLTVPCILSFKPTH